MLSAILVFIFVLLSVATGEHSLNHGFEPDENGDHPRFFAMTGFSGWITAIILALVSGVTQKYVGSVGTWSVLFWLAMLACIGYTAWEFTCAGTEWREWLPFAVAIAVMGIPFMAANVAIQKTVLASAGVFWKSVFDIVSWLLLLAAQAWMLQHLLWRREWDNWAKALGILALIVALLLLIFGIEWGALKGADTEPVKVTKTQVTEPKETKPQETEPQETELKYVHDLVLVDNDPMNDLNFGPDAIWTVVNRKLADGKLTKDQVEDCKGERTKLAELITADDLMDELMESIHDPAGLAAFWASLSVRLHIPFADDAAMFSFDGEKNMDRTNAMAKVWDADPERFERDYKKLCQFLARIYSVEIREVKNISNQMYMFGFDVAELPNVVFYESDENEAIVLVLTWAIKGELVKLEYNTICDFQLINGAEDFGVTPEPKPVNPKQPEPDPDPTPAPTEPKPTEPKPTEPKPKDPADDPVNQGNADQGGGENKPSDGPGEVQPEDPRTTEIPTGSAEDNHHGYSDPGTVTPTTPTAPPEHANDDPSDTVVDENPMPYETDPSTVDPGEEPTPSEGDGDFTPPD